MSRHNMNADIQPTKSQTLAGVVKTEPDSTGMQFNEYIVLPHQKINGMSAKDGVGLIELTQKPFSYYRYRFIKGEAPGFHKLVVNPSYIIEPTNAITTALDSYKNRIFNDFVITYGENEEQLELDNNLSSNFIKDILVKAIAYKSCHVILLVEKDEDKIKIKPITYFDHQIKDNKYYSIYTHYDKSRNTSESYVVELSYDKTTQNGEDIYQYTYSVKYNNRNTKNKDVERVINEWNDKLLSTRYKPFEFELDRTETGDVVGTTLQLYHQLDDYIAQRNQDFILGVTEKYINETSISEDALYNGAIAGLHKMFNLSPLGTSQSQIAITAQPNIRYTEFSGRIEATQSMIAHSMKLPSEEIFRSFNNSTATGVNAQTNMTVEQVKTFNELFRQSAEDLIKAYWYIVTSLNNDPLYNELQNNFKLSIPEYLESNLKDISQTVSLLKDKALISKFEAIKRINPSWNDDQVEYEVLYTKFENDENMTANERQRATELGILDSTDESAI
jgi:hypothetical protein